MTNIKVKEHKTVSTAHNEDYRILIRSVSEQFEHTEPLPAEETDKIELMTYGSFLKKAGSYYISYKETETIGFAGCTTTIKIAEDGSRVALLRFGKVNTQLVIQRDYRNICYYETEVGPITLGVTGDGIACDLSEPAGGTAKFSYLLDADDPTALINRTTLEIQVEHILTLSVIACAMPPPPKWEVLTEIIEFVVLSKARPLGELDAKRPERVSP